MSNENRNRPKSAPTFKVGEVVTVENGSSPFAVLTVAKVAKRVVLSDGSTWFVRDGGNTWLRYGERGGFYACTLRHTKPGDREAIAAAAAVERAKRDHERLTGRLVGLGWTEVHPLPTDALRRMVAILDEAKAAQVKEPG